MNEETLERVCRLAPALKQSAHLLLHYHHNLSLDTQTLVELQEAFSLILEMEQHTNFHVLPPNHRQHPAIPHLQMVYDLLQKVTGLRLWPREGHVAGRSRQEPVVSLRCFRSLRTLEVTRVPVTQLRALQALRSQLRRLVVTRGLTSLADLFVRCGADQAGEFVWEQLLEATLSHNLLQEGHLDDSLRLLPNLKVLDISHCGLDDVTHLSHLHSLSYLDISHNRLQALPHLPPTSSPALVVLLASHNAIQHLAGLQVMTGLEEVSLGHNFLASRTALVTLAALPRLRSLVLSGNPLCCDPDHRRAVLCVLHPGVVAAQFYLDGQPLTQQEQQLIGSISSPPNLLHSLSSPSSTSPLLTSPTEPSQPHRGSDEQPPSLTHETLSRTGQGTRRRSRKRRTRHITLGIEGEEEEEGECEQPSSFRQSPFPYIGPTPPEPTPNAAGLALSDETPAPPPPSLAMDSPLREPADTLTQALAALTHTTPLRSHPEQNDRLLEEILQAKPQHSPPPPPLPHHTTTTPTATTTITTTTTTTTAGGEEEEEEVEVVVEEEEEEKEVEEGLGFYQSLVENKNISPGSSDGEEEEEGACLILAQRLEDEAVTEDGLTENRADSEGQDVILSLTSTQFKEKNSVSTKTLFRWAVQCVENVVEVQPQQPQSTTTIRMTFDTTRPSHRSRVYTMEKEDYMRLQASLTALQDVSTVCDRCLGQLLPGKGYKGRCESCDGSMRRSVLGPSVPPLTSTPLQHLGYHSSLQEDSSEGVSVCSSSSGGGGGGGMGGHSVQPPWPATSSSPPGTRRESDVEVISNPSVSSIEVLCENKESVGGDDSTPAPATDVYTPAITSLQDPQSMQESSSSGSMTGSVCTAYERVGVAGPPSLPLTPQKAPLPTSPSPQPPASHADVTDSATECSTLYLSANSTLGVYASPPQHTSTSYNTRGESGEEQRSIDEDSLPTHPPHLSYSKLHNKNRYLVYNKGIC